MTNQQGTDKGANPNLQNNQQSVASLLRQWQLLQLLPARPPGITVTELLAKLQTDYKVARKTIERDLAALSTIFPLQCNDKSKPFGWYWSSSLQLPGMSVHEALALQLAEPMLQQLLPSFVAAVFSPKLNEARHIVQKNQQNKTLRLADKLAFVTGTQLQQPPVIAPQTLEAVQSALLCDLCIEVRYQSPYHTKSAHNTQLLHPLALVQCGLQLYLVAVVDGYQDTRLFALPRIANAQLSEKAAIRPDDFQLQRYLDAGALQFLSGDSFSMTARVNRKLARLLEESPLGEHMQLDCADPDWPLLTTVVQDSWNLRMWLLSQGSNIEVLTPPLLRQQIADELKETLALYHN